MKIAAYEVRPDEKPVIEGLCKKYGIELISTPANLDKTTANMAAGCDGVTTLGQSDYGNAVLDELKGYGVQVLAMSTCSTEFTDARTILLAWMTTPEQ